MRARAATVLVFVLVISILAPSGGEARKAIYSINLGGSREVGEASKYWNLGVTFGCNSFYPVTPNILIGGRFAYHRWTPEGNPNLAGARWIAKGAAALFNIYPSVRITDSIDRSRPFSLFIQVGAGYTIIENNAILTVVPVIPGDPTGWQIELMGTQNRPGFNCGAGITTFNRGRARFEAMAMYDYIYTEHTPVQYISFNIGVSIGM